MGFNKKELIKILIADIICAVLMVIISVILYNGFIRPQNISNFIRKGDSNLAKENYIEASVNYSKALKIDKNNSAAGYGLVNCYIGLGYNDEAVIELEKIQKNNKKNADILEKNIEILKTIDPEKAYELLMGHIDDKDMDKLSEKIKRLYKQSQEVPEILNLNPEPEKYATDIEVEIPADELAVGHIYYYTTNESVPDKNDKILKGKIKIKEDTVIKIVGYNQNGDASDIATYEYYVADDGIYDELKNLTESAKKKHDETEEGTQTGNCLLGAKEDFYKSIESSLNLLEKKNILYDEAFYCLEELRAAFDSFENSIIYSSDKDELYEEIQRAKELIENATEGSNEGEYKYGAKDELQNAISHAQNVYDSITSKQSDVDEEKNTLIEAKKKFETKKVTGIDELIYKSGAREGEVTVTLLWETEDDLDLYVTSPLGDTVFYNNAVSSTGGRLDIDTIPFVMGPEVSDGNKNYYIENIYWDNAPQGTYKVVVKNQNEQGNSTIRLKARVSINGVSKIYEKSITENSSEICRFTYKK